MGFFTARYAIATRPCCLFIEVSIDIAITRSTRDLCIFFCVLCPGVEPLVAALFAGYFTIAKERLLIGGWVIRMRIWICVWFLIMSMCVINDAGICREVVVVANIIANIVIVRECAVVAWGTSTAAVGKFCNGNGELHHSVYVFGFYFYIIQWFTITIFLYSAKITTIGFPKNTKSAILDEFYTYIKFTSK